MYAVVIPIIIEVSAIIEASVIIFFSVFENNWLVAAGSDNSAISSTIPTTLISKTIVNAMSENRTMFKNNTGVFLVSAYSSSNKSSKKELKKRIDDAIIIKSSIKIRIKSNELISRMFPNK